MLCYTGAYDTRIRNGGSVTRRGTFGRLHGGAVAVTSKTILTNCGSIWATAIIAWSGDSRKIYTYAITAARGVYSVVSHATAID